jgi:ubiquitin-conjugating enzyme E2 J2
MSTLQLSQITKKKIYGDMKLFKKNKLENFDVYVNPSNILEWYFLLKGPEWSCYNGGYYIGKITHNEEYPLKPPNYQMLTPCGRFLINDNICMSNTSYHEEEWSSSWNIITILQGFLSIMMDDKQHGVGHTPCVEENVRILLANKSVEYNITYHRDIFVNFKKFVGKEGNILIDAN